MRKNKSMIALLLFILSGSTMSKDRLNQDLHKEMQYLGYISKLSKLKLVEEIGINYPYQWRNIDEYDQNGYHTKSVLFTQNKHSGETYTINNYDYIFSDDRDTVQVFISRLSNYGSNKLDTLMSRTKYIFRDDEQIIVWEDDLYFTVERYSDSIVEKYYNYCPWWFDSKRATTVYKNGYEKKYTLVNGEYYYIAEWHGDSIFKYHIDLGPIEGGKREKDEIVAIDSTRNTRIVYTTYFSVVDDKLIYDEDRVKLDRVEYWDLNGQDSLVRFINRLDEVDKPIGDNERHIKYIYKYYE